MKNNQRKICLYLACAVIFTLAVCLLALGSPNPSWAQGKGSFLADRHGAKGQQCSACHKETPVKNTVSSAVCQQCHGNLEKVAEKTMDKTPNPHESHVGELKCEECHHGHKPSENSCVKCHSSFSSKVP